MEDLLSEVSEILFIEGEESKYFVLGQPVFGGHKVAQYLFNEHLPVVGRMLKSGEEVIPAISGRKQSTSFLECTIKSIFFFILLYEIYVLKSAWPFFKFLHRPGIDYASFVYDVDHIGV